MQRCKEVWYFEEKFVASIPWSIEYTYVHTVDHKSKLLHIFINILYVIVYVIETQLPWLYALVKFETNLKMYIKTKRHLVQVYISHLYRDERSISQLSIILSIKFI